MSVRRWREWIPKAQNISIFSRNIVSKVTKDPFRDSFGTSDTDPLEISQIISKPWHPGDDEEPDQHEPSKSSYPEPSEPSKRTLADIPPEQAGTPYCEWRARQLNELFRQHGVLKQPGRIKPETIMDGLEKYLRRTT
jgi:hypothetical protein